MSPAESYTDRVSEQSIIDRHGRPKDDLTLRIVRLFFSPPFPPRRPSFTAKEVAVLLAADFSRTQSIIHQLAREQILSEDAETPGLFRYNYDCPHADHQAKLEKHLLEEEMRHKLVASDVEFLPFNT